MRWSETHLMSSISVGDRSLMIGINVSIIHWFSQSHCQLLKRKSISSISSQRSSKFCGITDKLLLYKMSCKYKFEFIGWMRTETREQFAYRCDGWPFRVVMIDRAGSAECLIVYTLQFLIALGMQLTQRHQIAESARLNVRQRRHERYTQFGEFGQRWKCTAASAIDRNENTFESPWLVQLWLTSFLLICADSIENVIVQIKRDQFDCVCDCIRNFRE